MSQRGSPPSHLVDGLPSTHCTLPSCEGDWAAAQATLGSSEGQVPLCPRLSLCLGSLPAGQPHATVFFTGQLWGSSKCVLHGGA